MTTKSVIETIVAWIPLIVALAPLVIQVTKLVAQKRRYQNLLNLATRAEIVVHSLEQTNLAGPDKQLEAIKKLTSYANEVGISLNERQALDYIDNAVKLMKDMQTNEIQ